MATAAECEQALQTLATRFATSTSSGAGSDFDRSLSCTLRDLGIIFGAALRDGGLDDIRQVDSSAADIRLELTSDDLLALVDGELRVAPALANGRLKINAGLRDIMRLRSMF